MSLGSAIEILEEKAKYWEDRRLERIQQEKETKRIMALDIDEDLKHGRLIRYVGDPVYYDKEEHKSIVEALNRLKS